MYLRLINVKAIERQRDSYILVINNRYEKMGESLYRINKDALEIIRNLNGTKTFDDLVDMMISCHLEKKEQAKYKLNNFLNELEKNPGISVEYLKKTNPIEIPILGNGKTQYPSAISVEITHRCNAKCLHCYGEYCATNAFKDNTEEIKKLLKDARKAGTRVVEFTGGEVTCHPRFLEILNEAYNLDYSLVSILSNGLFWNKELFALIAEHKEQTVVQIDLHGDNDDYINWFMGTQIPNITHRVKDTIMRINNSGILMRVVTMVTPQNIDQIENIAGWVKEAGIETYGISAITPMGINSEIIYLDEPTSGVDPLSRVEIRKIIQKLKEEGKTILITSHDLSEIEKSADYVTMIENGKVVFNEDIDNIKGTTLEELFIKEGGDYE